jgi:hypothetical protein
MFEERPIYSTIKVHRNLINEFELRKKIIEDATGRHVLGGQTEISKMAAEELRLIRLSGEEIMKELLNLKDIPIKKFEEFGVVKDFVPYDFFRKVLILSSTLNKKKDIHQIKMEIFKIRGMNKSEIKYVF